MNRVFDILNRIDDLSRIFVDYQIKLLDIKQKLEYDLLGKLDGEPTPNKCFIEYSPGPPRELKITSLELWPPKIKAHVEPINRWPKTGPSAYSKIRDLWFKAIKIAKDNNPELYDFNKFQQATIWFSFVSNDKRLHDPDNYAIKFIIDPLVKCDILQEDDGERVKYIAEAVHGKEKKVVIILKESFSELENIRPKLSEKYHP